MPTLTVAPFTFSRVMRSTWMTHFRRYTCTTLPSRPLKVPRTTCTSSSLRTGADRTLYLLRRSAESGALISTRRTLDGAVKCAFRDFLRELDTRGLYFILTGGCGGERRRRNRSWKVPEVLDPLRGKKGIDQEIVTPKSRRSQTGPPSGIVLTVKKDGPIGLIVGGIDEINRSPGEGAPAAAAATSSAENLPFALSAARPRALRSRRALRSLSSFSFVMTTLEGLMPTLTVAPFTFSRVMRSTWMTHFRRYTCTTLPSRPLKVPRTTCTSSSLRTGADRTLYLLRRSAESGALISTRRTLDGAVKCAFRDFLRELDTRGLYFILTGGCGGERRRRNRSWKFSLPLEDYADE
ncbi:hypothetical protein MUK42_33062 [Musa troglodytarum]|uniref:Uncharacterized protein n=1 Tax=Musa troglodytarum TaxID=320322 RepID=A0A9E7HSP0_9LILI|nr:hypothetical protein MUK42_33062 [Musa troglodytarum]